MKDEILDMFFNQKMKQKDIATKLGIAKSTVSKTVNKDSRFINEKVKRKAQNKIKRNKDIQKRVEKNRKKVQFESKLDDLFLKHLHAQDSMELSKGSHLTNENYRKWNISAYKYNSSKRRYEFDNTLGRSYDIPKYIKER